MNLIVFHLKYTLEILFLLSSKTDPPRNIHELYILQQSPHYQYLHNPLNSWCCSTWFTTCTDTFRSILSINKSCVNREWGAPFILTTLQYYDKRLPRDAGDGLPASDACLFVLAHPPGGTACVSSALKSDSFQCVCRCHFAPDAV